MPTVRSRSRRAAFLAALTCLAALAPSSPARAEDDLARTVARAREQVENGSYADALKTLDELPKKGVPAALAVEAGLLETTAALVVRGAEAAASACSAAVVAAEYDPDLARDQSPKVRAACQAASRSERAARVERAGVTISALTVKSPEVAWQPVRVSATSSGAPGWLRVVARVRSSALEGSFDLALAPSLEGPLRGTLDASWLRPGTKIEVELVAQDRFGDLGPTGQAASIAVPSSESLVVLASVPEGSRVTVDGSAATVSSDGRISVAPGTRQLAMVLLDGASASATVEATPGSVTKLALAPQKPTRSRTLAWMATGTTLALGAAGGVLLLNADARRAEIEELATRREPGTALPAVEYADLAAREDERQTFATVGTALLIGAGVTGLAALTLWLWPDGDGSGPASSSTGATPRAASGKVRAYVGPGGLGLSGSF